MLVIPHPPRPLSLRLPTQRQRQAQQALQYLCPSQVLAAVIVTPTQKGKPRLRHRVTWGERTALGFSVVLWEPRARGLSCGPV